MSATKKAKITEENRLEAARLRELWESRPHRGQAEFGEHYGLGSQGNVGHYLAGRNALNPKAAAAFAAELKCQIEDFSPRVARELHAYDVEIVGIRGQKNKPDELVIPQFETGGAMGGGLLLRDQPGIIRGWSVNQEWVSKNVRHHSGVGNLCIVTGFGDSMRPMFNPGDPLLVDSGVKTVEFDSVYFFRVDAEGFVKRLQRIPGEGLRVLSANKEYEPWTIKPAMDFEIFGRVLKAWRSDDF